MPPKRKAAASSASKKKAPKKEAKPEPVQEPEPAPAPAPAKSTTPAKSPKKEKALASKSVTEAWNTSTYVSDGVMGQEGFGEFIGALGIEEMSFEAIYLIFKMSPSTTEVTDAMIVCDSKKSLQGAMDGLGCKSFGDLPAKLRARRALLQADFGHQFSIFFRWLFEMGKAISAVNNDQNKDMVRTVPLDTGLFLMDAVLSAWPLMPKLKAYCEAQHQQPFSRDLWTQIGRFVNMTQTGQIQKDLSNYDDDASGGGSAWPCAIDDVSTAADSS